MCCALPAPLGGGVQDIGSALGTKCPRYAPVLDHNDKLLKELCVSPIWLDLCKFNPHFGDSSMSKSDSSYKVSTITTVQNNTYLFKSPEKEGCCTS